MELLPIDYSGLNEQLKLKAETELFENEDRKSRCIEDLKALLREETDLRIPEEDDAFLLQFLRARKFDVQKASQLCKNYFKIRQKNKMFYEIDELKFIRSVNKVNGFGFLPHRHPDGSTVCVIFSGRVDLTNLSILDMAKSVFFGLMLSVTSPATQVAGYRVIIDMKEFKFKVLLESSPQVIWNMINNVQNCFPGRIKSVHVLNENRAVDYLWRIVRLVLSKKLDERCLFHGRRVEELHEIFPPSILPAEFGGDLGPFDSTAWVKSMEDNLPFFTHMNQYGYGKEGKG